MARYLLDTDTIIDYLNQMPMAVALFNEFIDRGDTLCLCDVVIAEVFSGVDTGMEDRVEPLLAKMEYLPVSAESARQAGTWRFQYARQGSQLATTDVLVAAAALQADAIIVTGNVRDYPMPEVALLQLPR